MFAADFRDRVVHHLLIAHQTKIYEPRFIHDSYACRPGKGVLAASDRLMKFLRSVTANGRRPAWALKLDVASFFPSIDKQILFALLCRHMRDEEMRWLTGVLLFHDPTRDYRFRSGVRRVPHPGHRAYPVPEHKAGELEADGLTELDVAEAILNAVAIYKTLRSRSTRRQRGDKLYVVVGTTLTGLPVYTKGKFLVDAAPETYYFLISSKRAD